jgi:ribose-phosphate pyrophosphokinase
MHGELTVVGGTSHRGFVEAVARQIGVKPVYTEVPRFKNDNMMVRVPDNVRGRDVFFVQTSCPPVSDHIMETLLTIDALKHSSADRITLVVPYMPYVRSDKKDQPRISIAARLMANLYETAGADRVLVMDLHAAQIHGFFDVPVDHLKAVGSIVRHLRQRPLNDYVVVASDICEMKEAGPFANRLDLPLAVIDKRRTGNDDKSTVSTIIGDIKGKHCLLVDDETATAGTLCNAAAFLTDRGAASVEAAVTHGVLEGDSLRRIEESALTRLLVTDTVPVAEKARKCGKIEILSVANVFADAIRRIHSGDSLGVLFE